MKPHCMSSSAFRAPRSAFALIELLVVIAIIALLAAHTAFSAMVNPSLDDPNREWCYLAKSTTVIGVPFQPDVVQVTWDGALFTGQAELCFFYGNPPQAVMARQKTFLDGWIPIVEYNWQTNGVGYCVEMFSAVVAGGDASNALQFAQVTVTNLTAQPTNAMVVAACRGSGQDYRFGSPSFSSAWTFAITNNALVRNGQWVYGFDAGAQSVEAVKGIPYTGPFVGTTYGLTARVETGVVTYNAALAPGEARSFRFKLPRLPVLVSNTALINSIVAADYNTYRSNTIALWEDLVGSRCRVSIPAEPRVEHAHRASEVHVLLATRTVNGQEFQSDGLPYLIWVPLAQFDYEQIYDALQLPSYFEPNIQKAALEQRANGQFDSALYPLNAPAYHGRMLMAIAEHMLMARDTNYAATFYTNIQRAVSYISNQHNTNTNGLAGPTPAFDAEMISGYWTCDNIWCLAGLRKAICVARLLGQQQDVTNWTALEASYEQSVLQAIQSSAESDGYVPTGLGAFTFSQGDYDWENMLLAWPTEALDPNDPKALGTVARVRRTRYHEGIMSYRNGMHEHQYITANNINQDVVAGRAQEALLDLYHTLVHCGPTSEAFENMVPPWQDRMLSLSPYVPPPHAWGASKIAGAIHNMFVMEYGGRLGLDVGQRKLMLFSAVSPSWAVPGQTISVTNASTEFGKVSAWMTFSSSGAHVALANQFVSPPGQIVIRLPYFVTNVACQSDATTVVLTNGTLQLSPDATRADFTWQWNTNAEPSALFQNTVLGYRCETPFWSLSAGHNGAPAPAAGTLSPAEQQHALEMLSFSNILQAFQYEYAVRYTNFVAGGGQPDVIAAPTMVVAQTGTLLQYGFDFTSGSVANSGTVQDDSGNGRNGFVLGGNGGVYTNDLPATNKLQYCTGIGSLNLASGSITTDPTGAQSGAGVLGWTDILRNGGLTMEVWAKGGGGSGRIFTIAAEYLLTATTNGVSCGNGLAGDGVSAAVDMTQWHHLAAEFVNPSLNGSSQLVADLQLYVDGQMKGTYTGSVFSSDLQRGASLGNHPLLNSLNINEPFTGLVYEPRITLGALSPALFTIKLPAAITITQQPANVTVQAGSTAVFSISATVTGAAPSALLYQWQKNQTNIVGATNASYTTLPLATGDASQYRCVVSTADGLVTATSAAAQAFVLPPPHAVLQWAFPQTAGSLAVPIPDVSGAGHAASNLLYTSLGLPVYSDDIPANAQFCSGTGSVDFSGTHAALSSANSVGIGSGQAVVTAAQIYSAGGLTMEVWVKNPAASGTSLGSPGYALNMAAIAALGVGTNGQVGFAYENNQYNPSFYTSIAPGQWAHLAVVMASPDVSALTYGSVAFYVNGALVYVGSNLTISGTYRTRAVSVGNHQYSDWANYEGLIYEPRITLGPLAPGQFTIKPLPPVFSFAPTSRGLAFNWTAGTLESAVTVTGPWATVTNATSPWTNNFTDPARFFRIRQ
jgi:prepilin-type N-terminal cleavage/methylation domain-containing protein